MGRKVKRFEPSKNKFSLLVKASEEAAEMSLDVLDVFFGLLHPSNHHKQALFFHPKTLRFYPIHVAKVITSSGRRIGHHTHKMSSRHISQHQHRLLSSLTPHSRPRWLGNRIRLLLDPQVYPTTTPNNVSSSFPQTVSVLELTTTGTSTQTRATTDRCTADGKYAHTAASGPTSASESPRCRWHSTVPPAPCPT